MIVIKGNCVFTLNLYMYHRSRISIFVHSECFKSTHSHNTGMDSTLDRTMLRRRYGAIRVYQSNFGWPTGASSGAAAPHLVKVTDWTQAKAIAVDNAIHSAPFGCFTSEGGAAGFQSSTGSDQFGGLTSASYEYYYL